MESTVIREHRQKRGTWVTERHVTDDGTAYVREYFAGEKTDRKAVLSANAAAVTVDHAAILARRAEAADVEARRKAAVQKLDVQDLADVLGISREDAEREKSKAETVREVSRG